jgi:CMP-N-acetylneuraminic acid synthetase
MKSLSDKLLAAIFARGGSKGVPRKTVRDFCGQPLISYAIEAALNSRHIDRIIVSTDDEEIAAVSREWGAQVLFMRPASLATDEASEWLAWQHAIETVESMESTRFEVLVSVPTVCPLRESGDIDRCIETLLGGEFDMVIPVMESEANPYYNMVTLDERGGAALVCQQPGAHVRRRQGSPPVYTQTSVAYAARRDFVMASTWTWDGRVTTFDVPRERGLDIDTELDFRFAEFMMQYLQGAA